MQLRLQHFTVRKRVALTISRGTVTETTNLWLRVAQDGIEGWGEASPFSIQFMRQSTAAIAQALTEIQPQLANLHPFERQAVEQRCIEAGLPSAAQAALDTAIHDWIGKKLGQPLWRLFGGDRQPVSPTSVTIGISSPDAAWQRLEQWRALVDPIKSVKIKLGSPAGIEADQAMFLAVKSGLSDGIKVSVDANGGWSLEDAIAMSGWLADHGVTYLEQPLPEGSEETWLPLYERSSLPVFADESCCTSRDIPNLADRVHGINIKLMKAGGLSEALRMIHTAQACGLQIMFGCYSDSALANTAAAHLASVATHLDLDSHLNLKNDPFTGVLLHNGGLELNEQPGLGVRRASDDDKSNGDSAP